MASQNPYLTSDESTPVTPAGTAGGASAGTTAKGGTSTSSPRLSGSAGAQQKVNQAIEGAQETVAPVVEGVQEKVGQVVDQAKQQTTSLLSTRKDQAAETLYTVAHVLRQGGQQLREQNQGPVGSLADTAATRVEGLSGYLRDRDVRQIVDETEGYARQHPGVFLGTAVTLGVLAARFLKSSRRQQQASTTQSSSTALVPTTASATGIPGYVDTAGAALASDTTTSATTTTAATSPSAYAPTAADLAGGPTVRVSSDEPSPAVVTGASYGAGALDIEDDARQAGGMATATDPTTPATPRR